MADKVNAGPRVTVHDVVADDYRAFVKYVSQIKGWTVTEKSTTSCTLTAADTELRLEHDATAKTLQTHYANVPVGLETFFWGHKIQRLRAAAAKAK